MTETFSNTKSHVSLDHLSLAQIGQLRQESAEKRKRMRAPSLVPQNRAGCIPASYAQERLWLLDQIGLTGAAYNIPIAINFKGVLDISVLEHCLSELVRRHETLRTHFDQIAGSPIQVVDPPRPFKLVIRDVSALEPNQMELEARRFRTEEAHRPFNLSTGPMLSACLLKLAELEHDLLLTLHHIACDGWSLSVLTEELGALYEAYSQGRSSPLPELPIQYADYALWQRQWLEGDVLNRQLSYWSKRLDGIPPQLELPTDRRRPAIPSFTGGTLCFEISATLRESLEDLAKGEGATLFMVFLAAYQSLLSRYSGQKDIVVGSASAGRTHVQTEGLIGFFVNTFVLRADLSGNPSFRELLRQVKETTLEAYAHQDVPFEKIVKELRPDRNLTRQPVFQVALALQNYPRDHCHFNGLRWSWSFVEQTTALFDLTLHLSETSQGMKGEFEFATDLFDRETIHRMSLHLGILLEKIVAEPDCPVNQLRLLTDDERRQLLSWHGGHVPLEPNSTVIHVLERAADLYPGTVAVCLNDRALTYRALNVAANRLARRLLAHGIRSGDRIGVHTHRNIEWVVAFYAILKLGAVYVPLNPAYPADRLKQVCRDADIGHVIVTDQAPSACDLPGAVLISARDDERQDARSSADFNLGRQIDPMAPAYAIYTSGSTGRPKGVLLHHRGLSNILSAQRSTFMLNTSDRVVQLASISFDASVFELTLALGAGACIYLNSAMEPLVGAGLHAFVTQNGITAMTITPSALASLSSDSLPSLQTVIVAGEALPLELARVWTRVSRVFNAYGPTECTIWATTHECDTNMSGARVPIGKPISNVYIHVLDADLHPVSIGEIGELWIGGAGVGIGYINRPDLSATKFIDDPVLFGQGTVYRTEDLARWRADGSLEFAGRADSQVKIRGHRIEPVEIESSLLEHAAVKQVVVVAREDVPTDRRLVAYIVPERELYSNGAGDGDADALRNQVVRDWQTLYEDAYTKNAEEAGPTFDGWNSSYTNQPIPEPQMQEWLISAADRIRTLGGKRVLEIGCGVGLLVQQLAPHCDHYVGTDISSSALNRLRKWLASSASLRHVQLLNRSAEVLQDFAEGSFDTVVLNSVVQYFPDIHYLMAVLQECARLLRPGGAIFLGDVRHFSLLSQFHSAVQLSRAHGTVRVGQLKSRVARAMAQDKELAIDPAFFYALLCQLPGITAADIQLKRGRADNELIRYRYDVVLYADRQARTPFFEEVRWPTHGLPEFEALLAKHQWHAARVSSIPNARLAKEAAARRLIETSDERLEVGILRRDLATDQFHGVEPEALWQLGEQYCYDVRILWNETNPQNYFDVYLLQRAIADRIHLPPGHVGDGAKPWSAYANDPLESSRRQRLIPQLRAFLKQRLPDYLIPDAWVLLTHLPLTSSGKANLNALPAPFGRPEEIGEYVAPCTEMERILARIWAQVLRVNEVGAQDNFFELGGHSLLATRVMSRIRELVEVDLPLKHLFDGPTVRQLARHVEMQRQAHTAQKALQNDRLAEELRQNIDSMADATILSRIAALEKELGYRDSARGTPAGDRPLENDR